MARSPQIRIMLVGLTVAAFLAYRVFSGPEVHGPRVYLEFESGGEPMGRVVIGLYDTKLPDVAANFRGLASGERELGYQNSPVHRVVRNYVVMAGDITAGDGSGSKALSCPSLVPSIVAPASSIFSSSQVFKDTGLRHKRGSVSMVVHEDGTIASQFFIACMGMTGEVDKSNVVFGTVLSGMDVVDRISQQPADPHHRPLQPIIVSSSGVLPVGTSV